MTKAGLTFVLFCSTLASSQTGVMHDEPLPSLKPLARLLLGHWTGRVVSNPINEQGSSETGVGDETWTVAPGGVALLEANRITIGGSTSSDFAAIWWNPASRSFEGLWCADYNGEGCNGFDVQLEGFTVVLSGEWLSKGTRKAWRETFTRPTPETWKETLSLGPRGGPLKLASVFDATKAKGESKNAH